MLGWGHERGACSIGATIKTIASIVALVMLVTFPAGRTHQFTNHFRTTELRGTMERLVAVAEPPSSSAGELADHATQLAASMRMRMLAEPSRRPFSRFNLEYRPTSLVRILMRLKLGHAFSRLGDPLI